MQMFVLDPNPKISACNLCDVHIRVICREVTMLLSSWYCWNVSDTRTFLPYKPMNENQPLAKQMEFIPVRRWAIEFAGHVFDEFEYRFRKPHASRARYQELLDIIDKYDSNLRVGRLSVRFTFVAKGDGIFPGKTMSQTVRLYRAYYRHKIKTMSVPVVYTGRQPPEWL